MVKCVLLSAVVLLGSIGALWAADPVADAASYKKLGDQHAAKDEVKSAADAYEQALTLGRSQFTADERVRMAVVLSWDDRLKTAIQELNFILEKDPVNLNARLELARIYSWDGQLTRAVNAADELLALAPNDTEALLVKANALEWDDRFDRAIPLYQRIIDRDGEFDARLGLASSLLYSGDRTAAQRQLKTLTASNSRQKRQLQKVSDALDRETRPNVEVGYNFYSDSDSNHYRRYSARYGVGVGNHDFEVNIGRTNIEEGVRSDDVSFQADFNASSALGLAAGIGLTRLHDVTSAQFPTGLMRLHGRVARTSFSGGVTSEILSETASLVANHVRRLSFGGDLSRKVTSRWSVGGAYNRLRFSDTNQANDAQVRTEFTVTNAPRVKIGYQLRYADYDRQSGGGFFDPSNFVSHRFSGSVELERRKFSTFVQVYGGRQSFSRYGEHTSEWAKGGRASFGFKATAKVTVEINASAGDFATGSVSGFHYFTAGSRVGYRF
jgi:tetratricopeptide (TPR) repeat protein